ncbi:hypothetical protein HAX54_015567 [Datura stramonium]|uniref:Uncharacterized protein n=1 Tax=Datura stramonium TaxID=4076 RepID=A0ABS8RGN9_DATST|nr:hypothetical protein [Datura stramonium]
MWQQNNLVRRGGKVKATKRSRLVDDPFDLEEEHRPPQTRATKTFMSALSPTTFARVVSEITLPQASHSQDSGRGGTITIEGRLYTEAKKMVDITKMRDKALVPVQRHLIFPMLVGGALGVEGVYHEISLSVAEQSTIIPTPPATSEAQLITLLNEPSPPPQLYALHLSGLTGSLSLSGHRMGHCSLPVRTFLTWQLD